MEDLIRILRESELSRALKLHIIDLICASTNEQFINDIIDLIKSWDTADNKAQQDLLESLNTLHATYEDHISTLMQSTDHKLEQLEHEADTEDQIATLKKSIQ